MATHKFYLVSLCLIWLLCIANAEVVVFSPCDDNPGSCTIHEVRIQPCPESEEHTPCKVKRGKTATIEFDYTTQWDSSTAHGQVYSVTDDGDLPMAGMNTNACDHTSCPIQTSNRKTYIYNLLLAKKFPVGTYTARWVLRNPEKPETSSERCCFTFKIKLTKWNDYQTTFVVVASAPTSPPPPPHTQFPYLLFSLSVPFIG